MKSPSMTPTENPALLRAALNLSTNGVMLFQCMRTAKGSVKNFRLVLANRVAETVVGMSEQDMPNRMVTDLFPRLEKLWPHVRHVVETGENYETELQYQLKNQPIERWYKLIIQKHGDGMATSFTDITALKQQADLAESVLNGSINGMVAYTAMRNETGQLYDLRIQLANNAAARILGSPLERLVNNTMLTLHPANQTSGLFARYTHTIETGEAQRFECHYTQDGMNGWFDISISKLGDGMLMTFMDISATKRYEQELQKSIETLKRSNQSLEQFAYAASHDLQEPLRKILSFGDLLRNQSETVNETTLSLINRMQSAAGRMNTLIQDLLTFSRLSSQNQPFVRINLQEVVDYVLIDLETIIRDKQATLDVTSLPIVLGNEVQLRQVFQNLLSNSLKFVKAGTVPRIRIDCMQLLGRDIVPMPGRTVAEVDLDRSFFAIGIVDNGIGFDEKYLDQIFTVFQRLHSRNEYQGTGIGLNIVQKVVENHNGYISAHSQPNEGATFTIYLPDEPESIADNLSGLDSHVRA